MRIMLALARYGGMHSHETRIQRWDHIDLPNRIMKVRIYKNHKIGQKVVIRVMKIFPELLPHLMRAKEMAGDDETVVTRYSHDADIGIELERIVRRADLIPWVELWQNMRRTRETELRAKYPAADVTSWLGNSITVAQKHDLMTMKKSFDRAIKNGASIGGVTAGVVPQKRPQPVQDDGSLEVTSESENAENVVNDADSVLAALGS